MSSLVTDLLQQRTGSPRAGVVPSAVASSKTSSAYRAHSYPTKIPPEAIVPFIEASTGPGALVLDPFCGSGMTGVAAMRMGRSVLLSDLSPGAVHLARSHTTRLDPERLRAALAEFDQAWMLTRERSLYGVSCPTCHSPGITRHMIWSDVLACPDCGSEVVAAEEAGEGDGSVPRTLVCPACGSRVQRAGASPKRSRPVRMTVACGSTCRTLQTSPISPEAEALLERVALQNQEHWVPTTPIEVEREMYKRSALHLRGVKTVADFYLDRSKRALGELWFRINQVQSREIREGLRFAFTNTAWHSSRMRRFNARGGQRPLTGTLYIPQLVAEANVFEVFRNQVQQAGRFYSDAGFESEPSAVVRQSSATDLSWIPDDSVDYIFTDPPFGSNIFYGDCNLVWEAWLGDVTDVREEMVVNRSRTPDEGGKTVDDYEALLEASFLEMRRVLRPGSRASVVFHNSDDLIWTAMLAASERAGLRQIGVSLLDKGQRSMKGYRGRAGFELVPFYDLVITFAQTSARAPELNGVGDVALNAIREHLAEADRRQEPLGSPIRSLEYLYSVAIGNVIREGRVPLGLSFRSFEEIASGHFARAGNQFALA